MSSNARKRKGNKITPSTEVPFEVDSVSKHTVCMCAHVCVGWHGIVTHSQR